MTLPQLKKELTLPEFLDYKESLEAMQMLSDAVQKDADSSAKAQQGK
jgi:hypothetical protein|tara:strand:- start:211 stop:351 length:141 start_codon:yes stop_codon:yes gene_type:complete